MSDFIFYRPNEIQDVDLKIAVIAARYKDKWVFCRHRQRNTWEMPGGHKEQGETTEETAKRELREETGATEFDITPVLAVRDDKLCGMFYYADVKQICGIPEKSEMEEIELYDNLPEKLTYPTLYTELFLRLQGWLNIQSCANEMWDVYNSERKPTGRLHRRGDVMPKGDYHLVVHVWLMNSKGEFLLTKRAPNKGFPNMWESTGGSALAGDDSLMAAMREVKEETGLSVDPKRAERIMVFWRESDFVDVWLFRQDFDLHDVILREGETCDRMYADAERIKELSKNGKFVPYTYLERLFELCERSLKGEKETDL